MRYTSKFAVEYDLQQHYLLKKDYEDKCVELSEYEGFRLKEINKRKDKPFFSIKAPGESRFQYAGDSNNTDILRVRELSYFKEMLRVIETNIHVMEEFLNIYKLTKAENINDLLPKVYRLPRDLSLLKAEPEISNWLQENKALKAR